MGEMSIRLAEEGQKDARRIYDDNSEFTGNKADTLILKGQST